MSRYRVENGITIQLTAQEETDRDAEELAYANAKPMKDWSEAMNASDYELPRYAEDILDGLNPVDYAKVSATTRAKNDAKKALRATRP
jgi:hypothetical protein